MSYHTSMRPVMLQPVAGPSSRAHVGEAAQVDTFNRHEFRVSREPIAAVPRSDDAHGTAQSRGRRCALISLSASVLSLGTFSQVRSPHPPPLHPPRPTCLPRGRAPAHPQAARGATIMDGLTASGGWLDVLPIAPPEPVRFPRRGLDQRFAVLLMQSSYRAVDALDFIPMVRPSIIPLTLTVSSYSPQRAPQVVCAMPNLLDSYAHLLAACAVQEQFQVRFWKLRQAEYSPYTLQCSPLRVSRDAPNPSEATSFPAILRIASQGSTPKSIN